VTVGCQIGTLKLVARNETLLHHGTCGWAEMENIPHTKDATLGSILSFSSESASKVAARAAALSATSPSLSLQSLRRHMKRLPMRPSRFNIEGLSTTTTT
jgi:hypothetical protein